VPRTEATAEINDPYAFAFGQDAGARVDLNNQKTGDTMSRVKNTDPSKGEVEILRPGKTREDKMAVEDRPRVKAARERAKKMRGDA
jgi:hypothetical protein